MNIQRLTYTVGIIFCLIVLSTVNVYAHEGPHVIVDGGETLGELAEQYNTDIETLLRLNNLSDANLIRSGNLLALPAVDSAASASTAENSPKLVLVGDLLEDLQEHPNEHSVQAVESELTDETSGTEDLPLFVDDLLQESSSKHVVQIGDTLATIAYQYGLSATDLAYVNQLLAPSLITPGQVLIIEEAGTELQTVVASESITATSEVSPAAESAVNAKYATEEKWIDVDLSEQIVVAYEGATPVNRFVISSGLAGTPTVTGEFRIWAKTPIQDMYGGNRAAGDDFYLEDVEWVQYFHEDYGFHGTYWHNNFGQPMSRGCINMQNGDAEWLFKWASPQDVQSGWFISDEENPGTLVVVHE